MPDINVDDLNFGVPGTATQQADSKCSLDKLLGGLRSPSGSDDDFERALSDFGGDEDCIEESLSDDGLIEIVTNQEIDDDFESEAEEDFMQQAPQLVRRRGG